MSRIESDIRLFFIASLKNSYDKREALNLFRLLVEDLIHGTNYNPQRAWTGQQLSQLQNAIDRLLSGEPVQHITGIQYFYNLPMIVNKDVLIPRPETEELVYWILQDEENSELKLLDIGCGSGCIPIAIAYNRQTWDVYAMEISEDALRIARRNDAEFGTGITFELGDIMQADKVFPNLVFDLVVSNPPYIPLEESSLLDERVRSFEPALALFVDNEDPLLFYKQIIHFCSKRLRSGGSLYFECHPSYIDDIRQLFDQDDWQFTSIREDMQGRKRMLKAGRS